MPRIEISRLDWVTVLSGLSCAIAFAWLVIAASWNLLPALLIVAAAMMALVASLLSVAWMISPPEDRPQLFELFRTSVNQEVVCLFGLRK